uniref:Ig-like domain-containing protein n=1 Tax=Hucho hucho TaxID=62062 RepID=A0A4W5KX91_9TELE
SQAVSRSSKTDQGAACRVELNIFIWYLIPSLDHSHAGFYQCIIRNRVGALLQRRTEVQVAFMGGFEEGERVQSVSQGEGAVVPAPKMRSFPQPQVTWFRDGRKIPPSSRIAITLDNTLVILSTVAPDAGRYYVQAVNDKNGENKTSQPITLSLFCHVVMWCVPVFP